MNKFLAIAALVLVTSVATVGAAEPKRLQFTNQVETLTNLHGKTYLKVKLDYAEGDFLYFDYTDSNGRGRLKIIDLKEADVQRLGLAAQSDAAILAEKKRVREESDKRFEHAVARAKETAAAQTSKEKKVASELVQQALDKGVFAKIDTRGSKAEVWVRGTFYLMDYDAKKGLALAVLVDELEGRKDAVVIFRDNLTGKEAASLSAWGFKVK